MVLSPPHRVPGAAPGVIRAAIYCRISLDRMGDRVKVADQEKLCREVAARRGWTVAGVYPDNSRSAWQRNRKRPQWDAMLEAVDRGEIDAIVVYHGDRLIRQPWDLELLIRLADQRGIRLASPTGERDLDNADDRFVLRIEAAQACRESDNTSRRVKRAHERQAEAGISPSSRRPYGWEDDGRTVRPAERDVADEAADRVIAGEPWSRVARDLTQRGLLTSTGAAWTNTTLKRMLLRPRNVGLMGTAAAPRLDQAGTWEPLLDRERWELLRRIASGRAEPYAHRTNAPSHLLSGIATCVPCASSLRAGGTVARRNSGRKQSTQTYVCVNPSCTGRAHIAMHHLENYVIGAVLRRLSDPRLAQALTAAPKTDAGRRLVVLEARRDQAVEEFTDDPDMPPAALKKMLRKINEQIAAVQAEIEANRTRHILTDYVGLTPDGWEALSLDQQRAIVRATVTVAVRPTGRSTGRRFDPARVDVRPVEIDI
ncbi:recombinase family protein [Microtetraspora malaysiensis]|uniref:recombinase family protein n=1 Tax=Microtetraspora malaysiensis TaxID=161358 RepID=UPI003D8B0E8C